MFSAKFNTSTLKGQAEKEFLYLDIFAVRWFSKAQAKKERKERKKKRPPPGPRVFLLYHKDLDG